MSEPYQLKIRNAIDYIELKLAEELTLETIAKAVHISPYHFHRIFHGIMNETLYTYILRRRMDEAMSKILLEPKKSITAIALEVGFNNHAAFSRAFKRYFGFTPTDVKSRSDKDSKIGTVTRKYGKAIRVSDLYPKPEINKTGANQMKVEIQKRPAMKIVYLPTSYEHQAKIAAWQKLHEWYQSHRTLCENSWEPIGRYYDDPEVTPVEKCRADHAVIIKGDVDVQGDFILDQIPAGTYAITQYEIAQEDRDKWLDGKFSAKPMHEFIQRFIKEWLLSSGYEADDYPLMMGYPSKNESLFDIERVEFLLKLNAS